MNNISVVETFLSVQGEGPNAGARCIFVRVKNCDFSCSFCDSKFTWARSDSDCSKYSPEELSDYLIKMCKDTNCHRVVLTGGNPCLYDFDRVIKKLACEDVAVDVETQGSIIPDWLHIIDTVVFSPKPPSSKMPDTYDKITDFILKEKCHHSSIAIKIPVFNDEDIEFARKYAKFINNLSSCPNRVVLYLSVGNTDVDTTESIRDRVLSDYELLLNKINNDPEDFQNVFILPQLHTLVWGNKQGV